MIDSTDPDGSTADKLGALTDKVRRFAKDRPFASVALAGVLGIALLNTLRGKGRNA